MDSSENNTRRTVLKTISGLGLLGVPHATRSARAGIAGAGIEFKRCRVAFVSDASAFDTIAVYYADRDGNRHARYGITPTVTDPRGHDPLVVNYNSGKDRTRIHLTGPPGSLVCVVAEASDDVSPRTNPTDACVPAGFNVAPSASFTVSDDPTVGEPVMFTSTATDPDAPERLFYDWDVNDVEATGETATTTFQTPGDKTVGHRVTDDCGASDTTTQTVSVAAPVLFEQVAKLTGSDTGRGGFFGYAVSIAGDTALIGANYQDELAVSAGAAYIFERGQGGADGWGEVTKLTASDPKADDVFGWSVSADGDTAVVGAPGSTVSARSEAYVFERDRGGADNWGQVTRLTASNSDDNEFGYAVSIAGDTALVGGDEATYVFERDRGGANGWAEAAKLTPSDGGAVTRFGRSVDIDGDTALVGAPFEDTLDDRAGAVYVFERNRGGTDNWGQVTKRTASDGEARDYFGNGVSIDGNVALAGASREDEQSDRAGAAYILERDQGGADNWGQVTKLTASDGETLDFFGYANDIDGDTALVGAWRRNEQGTSSGAAYVFERDQGGADNWGQVTKLTASDGEAGDDFGWSVSIAGDTTLVGARNEDERASKAGAAYIFE